MAIHPNLQFSEIDVGQAQKEVTANEALNIIADKLTEQLVKSVAGSSDVALTSDESTQNAYLKLTGALTGSINVTVVDGQKGAWIVKNATSGSFTLTLKTVTGAGVAIPQGGETLVYCDGTDVVIAISHAGLTDAGTNSHATIDTHLADASKHRVINDAGTSSTELWSASKINSELGGKYADSAQQDFVYEFCLDRLAGNEFGTVDIVASATGKLAFVAHRALTIRGVILSLEETGADASNPLELAADVKIAGTTCLTTQPKITKAAADGDNTATAGTGKTQAVVDGAANTVTVGQRLTVDLNLTRTASPATEMAGARVIIIGSYALPY